MGNLFIVSFGVAIEAAKNGHRIRRVGCDFDAIRCEYPCEDDGCSALNEPYMVMTSKVGTTRPWTPTMEDLFAEDWTILS